MAAVTTGSEVTTEQPWKADTLTVKQPATVAAEAAAGAAAVPGAANGKSEEPSPAMVRVTSSSSSSSSTRRYHHTSATHRTVRASVLSSESTTAPSFRGFRNLLVLVVVVMNLRLVIENFMKYGVLVCVRCHDIRRQDVRLGLALYAMVPCHLYIAYWIERQAAEHARGVIALRKRVADGTATPEDTVRSKDPIWRYVAFAHIVNATLCLAITTTVVFYRIHHPLIGTICQTHAIIVWLKNCSYAFTNRDLRHSMLHPRWAGALPDIYRELPYPRNITLQNLSYFWWAPTLVYQPVYPRTATVRWSFVFKRLAEALGLSVLIWLASAQYAAPLLRNSLNKMVAFDLVSILERLMKLSTISLLVWLAGFFAVFQSALNALAEIMRFGDREFYSDWWNSPSVGAYWRSWNKPVYQFMKRHIYVPLLGRGWKPHTASLMVFLFSAVLHEILVGVPTHNILGVAFLGMIFQIPLIAATLPLEKTQGSAGKILGNCVFWVSFCLVGQPLAALLYFFAWQAKYGSVSKMMK